MRALVILTLTLLALPVALAEEGAPPPDPAEPLANRQIYVPIKDLDVLLAARGGEGVLMSLEEYASLRAAARRSPPDPRAPLSAALRRAVVRGAESAGAAGEGGLALSVTLDVEIFTDDWVRMPLRLPTAAFSKVSVPEGVEVFLQAPAGKSRQHAMLLRGRGKHEVVLECATPVDSSGGDRRAVLALPRAVEGELEIALSGRMEVEASPPLASFEASGEGDEARTVVRAAIGSLGRLELSWHLALSGTKSPVLTTSVAHQIHVARDVVSVSCAVQAEIHHAPLVELKFAVPAGLDVFTVDAQELSTWSITGEGADRVLTVSFRSPFQGARAVTIAGAMALEDGAAVELTTPLIAPLDAVAVPATLGLTSDSRLEVVLLDEPEGFRRVSFDEVGVPVEPGRAVVAAYRHALAPGVAPRLRLTPEASRVETTVAALLRVEEARLTLDLTFAVVARGGPAFGLDVIVPAGYRVDEVTADRDDYDYELVDEPDGSTRVRGRLDRALAPEASFQLLVTAQIEPEGWREEWVERAAVFPMPGLPDTELVDGVYGVLAESIFDLRESSITDLVPLDAATLAGVLGGATTGFGYQLRGEAPALEIAVRRKPARADLVTALLFSPEDETLVRAQAALQLTIGGGGARELVLSLPAGTGDQVRITGESIAEKTRTVDEATGRDRWRVVLQDRVVGNYDLLLAWDLRRERGGPVFAMPDVIVHAAGGQPVRRELGWIMIEAGEEVEVKAEPEGLESVALVEVPAMSGLRPQAMVVEQYRFHGHEWSLMLDVERHDPVDLLGGFAHRVDVDTWLDMRGECVSRIDVALVNGSAQLFVLDLPPGATLWSAYLGDQPSRPSKSASGSILVPVQRSSHTTQRVRVVYGHAIPALSASGAFELELPRLHIPVLESHWRVHAPEQLHLVESAGELSPRHRLSRPPAVVQFFMGLRELFLAIARGPVAMLRASAPQAEGSAAMAMASEPAAPASAPPRLADRAHAGRVDRKRGLYSLEIRNPQLGGDQPFSRLSAGGKVRIDYLHQERAPQTFWFTLVLTALAGVLAMRYGGWSLGGVVAVYLLLGGLIPYVLGGDATVPANGLAGAAVVLVLMRAGGWLCRRWCGDDCDPASGSAPSTAPAPAQPLTGLLVAVSLALAASGASARDLEPVQYDPADADVPIVILYDSESGLPADQSGQQVFVPDPVFHELFRRAGRDQEDTGEEGVLLPREAEYRLALDEEPGGNAVLVGEARFQVAVLGEGWVDVDLGLPVVEVRSLTLDGQEAAARTDERGRLRLALTGRGDHEIIVKLAARAAGTLRIGQVRLELAAMPVATAHIRAPAGVDLVLAGARGATRHEDGELVAAIGSSGVLDLAWRPRTAEVDGAVVHVETATRWRLDAAGVQTRVEARYRVQRGEVEVVRWRVPAGLEITTVEGEGIRDWSVAGDSGDAIMTLEILFTEPLRGMRDLALTLSRAPALGAVDWLGSLAPHGVDHERGSLTVHADASIGVAATSVQALSRRDRSGEVPAGWPETRLSYGFTNRPIGLELEVVLARPRIKTTLSARYTCEDRETAAHFRAHLEVSDLPVASLDLELPAGLDARVLTSLPAAKVTRLEDETGVVTARFEFRNPVMGRVELFASGTFSAEGSADATRPLPLPRVLGVDITSGDVLVAGADDLDPQVMTERGLVSVEAAPLERDLSTPAGADARLAYRFRDQREVALEVRALRLEARVEVHVLTDVFVRDDFADLRYAISIIPDQRRGAVERFRFDLPATVTDVDILTSPPLRFVERVEVDTPAGKRSRFTLNFQGRQRGAFGLELGLPLEYGEGRKVVVPGLDPVDSALSGGHVVVENGSSGRVKAGETRQLRAVTRSEVPGLEATRVPVLTYRAPRPGEAALELEIERFERHETVSAQIELMTINTVVAGDGGARHQAELLVRNRDRQFLAFELPEGAVLWSVIVAGVAVRPVSGEKGDIMVRIHKTAAGERSFPVVLVYETPSQDALGSRGRLLAPAPAIRDMDVAETYWNLSLPEGYRFTGSGDELAPADPSIYWTRQVRRLRDERKRLLQEAADPTLPTETNTRALTNLGANRMDLELATRNAISLNPAFQQLRSQGGQKEQKAIKLLTQGAEGLDADWQTITEDAEYLRQVQGEVAHAAEEERTVLGKALERTKQQSESLGEARRANRGIVQQEAGGRYKSLGQSFDDANLANEMTELQAGASQQVELLEEVESKLERSDKELRRELVDGIEELEMDADELGLSLGDQPTQSKNALDLFGQRAAQLAHDKAKSPAEDPADASREDRQAESEGTWADDSKDISRKQRKASEGEPSGVFDYERRYEEQAQVLESLKKNLDQYDEPPAPEPMTATPDGAMPQRARRSRSPRPAAADTRARPEGDYSIDGGMSSGEDGAASDEEKARDSLGRPGDEFYGLRDESGRPMSGGGVPPSNQPQASGAIVARGGYYADTDVPGTSTQTISSNFSSSLGFGGGGGGTFGGRFGGRLLSGSGGGGGAMVGGSGSGVSVNSLAVVLPTTPVSSSFQRTGAASHLEVSYVSVDRARILAAFGYAALAILYLAALAWAWAAAMASFGVRVAFGLGIVLAGGIVLLAASSLPGLAIAAAGAILARPRFPWRGDGA